MIRFPDLQQRAAKLVSENASGLLTAGGVIGVGVTAVLTARASFKAASILREEMALRQAHVEEKRAEHNLDNLFASDFTKTEVVKLTWFQYVPPTIVGVATISSIVMANRVSAKRAAALAVAYGISEQRFQEYKDKVTEKFGGNKERDLRDAIAQDRVNKNPPDREVIILTDGDVLCFDMLTGRYFRSSVERIKRAESKINQDLFHHQYASLSSFYDEIGLPPTSFTDEVGWNLVQQEAPFEVRFSTVLSPDDKPCIAIDFATPPKTGYTQLY